MAPAVAEARPAASPGDGGSAFARALASGAQKQRDAALAALSRWLASRSEVDETEMLKLWKGLFYAMWHADKPAVQADVAERMAAVLDSSKPEVALAYFRGCFTTLRRDWFVIDRLRLDKYMLLVRKVMHHLFACLQRHRWAAATLDSVAQFLEERVLMSTERECALGLSLHAIDVFLPALAAAAPPPEALAPLLRPFVVVLAHAGHPRIADRVRTAVFEPLAAGDGYIELAPPQLQMVGQLLFDAGAAEDTSGKYRQLLYDLSKAFRRAVKREGGGDDAENGKGPAPAAAQAARGGRSNGTPHPGRAARDGAEEPRSGGSAGGGSAGGGSSVKRPRGESVENGAAAAAAPAALERVFEQAWTEPGAGTTPGVGLSGEQRGSEQRHKAKKQRKSSGGATPGDGVALTPRSTFSPASQYATPGSALTPYSAAARTPTPTPPARGTGGNPAAAAAATTPRPTPGGAKRVRWALSNIELFTPTGAPQTAAGKQALRCASAPKPTLRRNTPLSARVAATAAAASAARASRASGGGGGGGKGGGGKQRGTPHSHSGGGQGKHQQNGTPGSAPRPRAVDFF